MEVQQARAWPALQPQEMVRSEAQDTQGKAGRAGLVPIEEREVWRDLTAACS